MADVKKPSPDDDVHLIVAEDEEVVIEHHPEDWIAFVLFWALAIIVFLQFFTRYILNDSLSWTEEIARYGLMSLAFIGGAVVTRKKAPYRGRASLERDEAQSDADCIAGAGRFRHARFHGACWRISRSPSSSACIRSRMTVFDLPMSLVYGLVGLGCFMMLARQIQVVWSNAREGWRRPHEITEQIHAD